MNTPFSTTEDDLRQFIHRPVIFTSIHHNDLRETWMHPFVVSPDFEQGHWKGEAPRLQLPAPADFVSFLDRRSGSEERLQAIFGNLMFGGVSEQNDSGF